MGVKGLKVLPSLPIKLNDIISTIFLTKKGSNKKKKVLTLTRFSTAAPTVLTGKARSGIALPSSASS